MNTRCSNMTCQMIINEDNLVDHEGVFTCSDLCYNSYLDKKILGEIKEYSNKRFVKGDN